MKHYFWLACQDGKLTVKTRKNRLQRPVFKGVLALQANKYGRE